MPSLSTLYLNQRIGNKIHLIVGINSKGGQKLPFVLALAKTTIQPYNPSTTFKPTLPQSCQTYVNSLEHRNVTVQIAFDLNSGPRIHLSQLSIVVPKSCILLLDCPFYHVPCSWPSPVILPLWNIYRNIFSNLLSQSTKVSFRVNTSLIHKPLSYSCGIKFFFSCAPYRLGLNGL